MLRTLGGNLRRLCSLLHRCRRRRSSPKISIQKLRKSNSQSENPKSANGSAAIHPNNCQLGHGDQEKPIRVATFNASLFSMAPAVSNSATNLSTFELKSGDFEPKLRAKSENDRPKSILKQSPSLNLQEKFAKSKLRVSINLPDNEISRQLSFAEKEKDEVFGKKERYGGEGGGGGGGGRRRFTVVEVLKELDADILALQDVKAEEEKGMKPLSDLAAALGMDLVFAESWAPEYGNAILSKWPIKRWKSHRIFDHTDFRNVLKATIDVPQTGEINFHCTHLDHLDENWRMKQINAIMQSNDEPHILLGGLNSLDESDYSPERWTDIVKYNEDMGKPTPKVEVMRFLKGIRYTDAKDFAGECEPVVVIAKGQSVQGTCKYGTRLDYILASPDSPYKFVPGSYSVLSSKGTSDHHIVKVDITKARDCAQDSVAERQQQYSKQKFVNIGVSNSPNGLYRTNTRER